MNRWSVLLSIKLVLFLALKISAQVSENLGTGVNTTYNEFAPVIAPDGKTIYFLREGHPQNRSKEKYSCDIWSSNLIAGKWMQSNHLTSPFNTFATNSIYSISPDGNSIVVNWQEEDQKITATQGFGLIKKTDNGWSRAEKIEIPKFEKMCKGVYQFGSLSADGKTFLMSFSESKKSRIDDIYVSFLQKDGTWSEPMNLGDDINTDATECIPFLAPDGYTLYFSSDRAGGKGSNDIYVSKRLDRSWRKWSKPKNLGDKVNTEEYDGFFTLSAVNDMAYFVTRKGSLGKNDIVSMRLADIEGKKDAPTDIIADGSGNNGNNNPSSGALGGANDNSNKKGSNADPVVMLSGKIIDSKTGQVPTNAKVIYEDLNTGEELGFSTPDPNTGTYKIVLPYGKKYGITPIADGYLGNGSFIDLSNQKNGKYLEINGRDLKLVPIEGGEKITLSNIFFEFGKATLTPESSTELNRMISFLQDNKTVIVEIGGHTDNAGSNEYNSKLSLARAEAVKNYFTKGGVSSNRVVTKGYGETVPIASNDTEDGQAANRRVEFLILKK